MLFRSNLDTRAIDITADLRRVAKYPSQITFLQLYSDTPHKRKETKPHPVSGVITCCGLLHPQVTNSMRQNSRSYIENMEDNTLKLDGIISSRLEIVTKLNGINIRPKMCASDFFEVPFLTELLKQHPMFIPFYEDIDKEYTFMDIIKGIPKYLCAELKDTLQTNEQLGGFIASWRSYQLELSLETFFWGQPMLPNDQIWCTNLGLGTFAERSLTWLRGILGLVESTSAALPESPPPLVHWTKSQLEQRRIKRLFTFSDCLEASNPVIGSKLLRLLVQDLYDNEQVPFHSLKLEYPPTGGRCVGTITMEQLVTELSVTTRFNYPCTFGRACKILQAHGRSLLDVLRAGLLEVGFAYFPAFKVIDQSRHPKVSWNWKHFWNITLSQRAISLPARVALVTGDVLVNLENKKLTFARNLQPYKDNGMPWMENILSRLEKQNLSHDQLVHICTFLSSIALLQQNIYVDYNVLSRIELDLALSQKRLRQLQIQSAFLLQGINILKLWKLHEDIPIKLQLTSQPAAGRPRQWAHHHVEQPLENLVPDSHSEDQDIQVIRTRNLPANWKRAWSPEELDLVNEAIKRQPDKTNRQCYELYTKLCTEHQIPARTFAAFKWKGWQIGKTKEN